MVLLLNSAAPSSQNGASFNCLFLKEHMSEQCFMSLYPAIVNTRVLRYFDLVSFQVITGYQHDKKNWISVILYQWSILKTFVEWCTAVSKHCFVMQSLQNPLLCSSTFTILPKREKYLEGCFGLDCDDNSVVPLLFPDVQAVGSSLQK